MRPPLGRTDVANPPRRPRRAYGLGAVWRVAGQRVPDCALDDHGHYGAAGDAQGKRIGCGQALASERRRL